MNWIVIALLLLALPGYWCLVGFRLVSRLGYKSNDSIYSSITRIISISLPIATLCIFLFVVLTDEFEQIQDFLNSGASGQLLSESNVLYILLLVSSLVILSLAIGITFGKAAVWGVPLFSSLTGPTGRHTRGILKNDIMAVVLGSTGSNGNSTLYRGIVANMTITSSGSIDWVLLEMVEKCPVIEKLISANATDKPYWQTTQFIDESLFEYIDNNDPNSFTREKNSLYLDNSNIKNIYFIPLETANGDLLDNIVYSLFFDRKYQPTRAVIAMIITVLLAIFIGCYLFSFFSGAETNIENTFQYLVDFLVFMLNIISRFSYF